LDDSFGFILFSDTKEVDNVIDAGEIHYINDLQVRCEKFMLRDDLKCKKIEDSQIPKKKKKKKRSKKAKIAHEDIVERTPASINEENTPREIRRLEGIPEEGQIFHYKTLNGQVSTDASDQTKQLPWPNSKPQPHCHNLQDCSVENTSDKSITGFKNDGKELIAKKERHYSSVQTSDLNSYNLFKPTSYSGLFEDQRIILSEVFQANLEMGKGTDAHNEAVDEAIPSRERTLTFNIPNETYSVFEGFTLGRDKKKPVSQQQVMDKRTATAIEKIINESSKHRERSSTLLQKAAPSSPKGFQPHRMLIFESSSLHTLTETQSASNKLKGYHSQFTPKVHIEGLPDGLKMIEEERDYLNGLSLEAKAGSIETEQHDWREEGESNTLAKSRWSDQPGHKGEFMYPDYQNGCKNTPI